MLRDGSSGSALPASCTGAGKIFGSGRVYNSVELAHACRCERDRRRACAAATLRPLEEHSKVGRRRRRTQSVARSIKAVRMGESTIPPGLGGRGRKQRTATGKGLGTLHRHASHRVDGWRYADLDRATSAEGTRAVARPVSARAEIVSTLKGLVLFSISHGLSPSLSIPPPLPRYVLTRGTRPPGHIIIQNKMM
jgi:hypothetical protein